LPHVLHDESVDETGNSDQWHEVLSFARAAGLFSHLRDEPLATTSQLI
jgi:hypothetical protein